jgi:flagellar basal body-associated protein FliL
LEDSSLSDRKDKPMLEKEMVRAVLWIFLPIAIVLLSIVIVVSIDAIITYLKKRDEEARKERGRLR